MNTIIAIENKTVKDDSNEFDKLAFGDYFIYEGELYQKNNGIVAVNHINATKIENGCIAYFEKFHTPIKLVKEVNIEYTL